MKTSFIVIVLIIMGLHELLQTNCSLIESMSSWFSYQADRQCENQPPNGLVCIGCDVLAVCVKRNDEWEKIPVELCDRESGYQCNVNEGACSNKTGPCNPINNGTFACTSVGTFPDPYDCQLYHVCYESNGNLVSIEINCKPETAYDPITGVCSLSLNSLVCQEYGFTCKKAGDMGPWLHNPNIFYVCVSDNASGEKFVYPQLYKCDPNEVFINKECVKTDVTTTSSTTNSPGEDFKCENPGIYADIASCLHYYYCNVLLQAERYKCPAGTFFNKVSLACTVGSC